MLKRLERAIVADDEHIGVVPVVGTSPLALPVRVVPEPVDDAEDTLPAVVDIVKHPANENTPAQVLYSAYEYHMYGCTETQ